MIDTNVFLSAVLKSGSTPDLVLTHVCEKHDLVLCDHIINECYDVATRKFPGKIKAFDNLFKHLRFELIPAPRSGSVVIRDLKDQPILNAACAHEIDILITGDKHFLELDLSMPHISTPSNYKSKYMT